MPYTPEQALTENSYTADDKFKVTARATYIEITVVEGTPLLFTDFPNAGPCAVSVHPSPGATAYVSLSTSIPARIADGTYRLTACALGTLGTAPDGAPAGVVTSTPAGRALEAPVSALRVYVVGGTANVEIVQ